MGRPCTDHPPNSGQTIRQFVLIQSSPRFDASGMASNCAPPPFLSNWRRQSATEWRNRGRPSNQRSKNRNRAKWLQLAGRGVHATVPSPAPSAASKPRRATTIGRPEADTGSVGHSARKKEQALVPASRAKTRAKCIYRLRARGVVGEHASGAETYRRNACQQPRHANRCARAKVGIRRPPISFPYGAGSRTRDGRGDVGGPRGVGDLHNAKKKRNTTCTTRATRLGIMKRKTRKAVQHWVEEGGGARGGRTRQHCRQCRNRDGGKCVGGEAPCAMPWPCPRTGDVPVTLAHLAWRAAIRIPRVCTREDWVCFGSTWLSTYNHDSERSAMIDDPRSINLYTLRS